MGEYYKVDKKTILNYAREIGYDYQQPQILNDIQIQEIINCYYTDKAIDLAKKYGVSKSTIIKIWMKHNNKDKTRRIYKLENENYFETIDAPTKAYFLGFIGADGCTSKSNDKNKMNCIKISINKKDEKILSIFNNEIGTTKPISYRKSYATVEISSQKMFDDLGKLDLHPRKTYANCIANIDRGLFSHLIRGYFDGDGSIMRKPNKNCNTFTYTISISGYKTNLSKIQDYLNSVNIFSRFTKDKRPYTENIYEDDFGALTISNKNSIYCFLKLIYKDANDVYLDRKHDLAVDFINQIENGKNPSEKQIVLYYQYAVLPFIEKLDIDWGNHYERC